jgi:thioredoxin-related protein
MTRYLLILVLLLAAGCSPPERSAPSSAGPGAGWLTSWTEASAQAGQSGKPVLVLFSKSDGCAPCARMEEDVFSSPKFQEWAAQKAILLRLDFSVKKTPSPEDRQQAASLAQRLEVEGYPTVVLADASGKRLGELRYQGKGAQAFAAQADRLLAHPESDRLPWRLSFDSAAREAREKGKLVMMDFTGSDWCVWCIRLKEEVFDTQPFRTWADKNVVLLELDFPQNLDLDPALDTQNRTLAQKYGVEAFPTIIFCKPDGQFVGALGYEKGGPAAWLAKAEERIAEGRKRPQASSTGKATAASPTPTSVPPATATPGAEE